MTISARVPTVHGLDDSSGDSGAASPTEEDAVIGSALAVLWRRHRQSNLDRITLLEMTAADVLRKVVDPQAVATGAVAAHQLAGSLGTFGFEAGSRAALQTERLLREPEIDGRLLAEAVAALRASVPEVGDEPDVRFDPPVPTRPSSTTGPRVHVVSSDPDLISRIAVAGLAVGLAVDSVPTLPALLTLDGGSISSVLVDDSGVVRWNRPELMSAITALSRSVPVMVLTDTDSFDDRLDLTRAGAAMVIPRSQETRQVVAYLAEALDLEKVESARMLAVTGEAGQGGDLTLALAGTDVHLEVLADAGAFWESLEKDGADLVVVGRIGPRSSPADLIRVIRSHSRWHDLPVVVMGADGPSGLDAAMEAGADDYLEAGVSPHDLGTRLLRHLGRSAGARLRRQTDPLTRALKRAAAEEVFDRQLRTAQRRGDLFTLALVTVDHFHDLLHDEGNITGDVIMRRLADHLLGAPDGHDVVGRWSRDGFAVGISGGTAEGAGAHIAAALARLASESVSATSGRLIHSSCSAGLASFPADGTSLASLERTAESALGVARTGKNRVVTAGEHLPGDDIPTVDVILVEDDDTVADVIAYALGLRQYRMIHYRDGAEAAREMGGGRVRARVLLLDIGLPSLDGFGVLRQLQHQKLLGGTRVIMLTARSSEAELLRGLGLGATEYIAKPFSIPVLLRKLDHSLARSAA